MHFSRLIGIIALFLSSGAALACEGTMLEDADVYDAPLCIPETPKRIVVLDPSFGLGIALDVGLPIVGAPLDNMSDAALYDRALAAEISSTGFVTEPSFETIVALQPDLIVGFVGSSSIASGIYPMASRLAPTLLYTSTDWQAFYTLMGNLAGDAEKVEQELAALDARIADMRQRMPDRVVSVLRITSWDFQVYLSAPQAYAPFALLQQAGVQRTAYETTNDPELSMKRPDWEELAQLDGEVLLYIVGGTNASATDGRHEEVLGNPLWQMLPAVAQGNVHRVSHGDWMQFSGIGSAHKVLDDVERFVVGTR